MAYYLTDAGGGDETKVSKESLRTEFTMSANDDRRIDVELKFESIRDFEGFILSNGPPPVLYARFMDLLTSAIAHSFDWDRRWDENLKSLKELVGNHLQSMLISQAVLIPRHDPVPLFITSFCSYHPVMHRLFQTSKTAEVIFVYSSGNKEIIKVPVAFLKRNNSMPDFDQKRRKEFLAKVMLSYRHLSYCCFHFIFFPLTSILTALLARIISRAARLRRIMRPW